MENTFLALRRLLVIVSFSLTACVGGSSSESSSPTVSPTPNVTQNAIISALNSIDTYVQSVRSDSDRLNKTAEYLRSLGVFKFVRVVPSGVAAQFNNGPLLALTDSWESQAVAPVAPLAAGLVTFPNTSRLSQIKVGFAEVPVSKKAVIASQSGEEFSSHPPTSNKLTSMVSQKGYAATLLSPLTLATFSSVVQSGVLYLHTHGVLFAKDESGPQDWGITLDDRVDAATLAENWDRFADGSFIISLYMLKKIATEGSTFLGVTSKYMQENLSLSNNAIVILNSCNSGTDAAAGFRNVLKAKGAAAIFGWNGKTTNLSYPNMEQLVDRLAGANLAQPESPDQRPFGVAEVYSWMVDKGIHIDPHHGSALILDIKGDAPLLTPTIASMQMDNAKSELTISGSFGSTPGEVRVDDIQVPAQWTDNEIKATLPESGPGSAGPVLVKVLGRKSQARMLTEWRGRLTYVTHPNVNRAGNISVNMEIHLRADVQNSRVLPAGGTFFNQLMVKSAPGILGAGDVNAVGDVDDGVSLSGVGTLSAFRPQFPPIEYAFVAGEFTPSLRKVRLIFNAISGAGTTPVRLLSPVGSTPFPVVVMNDPAVGDGTTGMADTYPLYAYVEHMAGSDWSIPAGTRPVRYLDEMSYSISWSDIVARFPPSASDDR